MKYNGDMQDVNALVAYAQKLELENAKLVADLRNVTGMTLDYVEKTFRENRELREAVAFYEKATAMRAPGRENIT